MIGITKLLCGIPMPGDALRYEARGPEERRPVVVWNMTRACNLHCVHCYISARERAFDGELSAQEAKTMIDDLAEFGAPVLLFSGGEPLLRPDLFDLGQYAVSRGMRAVLSTNGTLITQEAAGRLKAAGFSYVGVSLDGMEETNDRFRGEKGAFQAAVAGMRNAAAAGLRVGLRFTIVRHNVADVPAILDLLVQEGVQRCCFYHLVYSGRAAHMMDEDLGHQETRSLMDFIFDRTLAHHRDRVDLEMLTVDNHTDGPYLYMWVKENQPERAEQVLGWLRQNGGNASGMGIAAIDNLGNVHADQFWQHYSFGNIRERRFSEIWTDTSDSLMAGLKRKKEMVKGRCAECQFLDICGGNLRVRAEARYGDVWAPDPACYLTDEEIGLE